MKDNFTKPSTSTSKLSRWQKLYSSSSPKPTTSSSMEDEHDTGGDFDDADIIHLNNQLRDALGINTNHQYQPYGDFANDMCSITSGTGLPYFHDLNSPSCPYADSYRHNGDDYEGEDDILKYFGIQNEEEVLEQKNTNDIHLINIKNTSSTINFETLAKNIEYNVEDDATLIVDELEAIIRENDIPDDYIHQFTQNKIKDYSQNDELQESVLLNNHNDLLDLDQTLFDESSRSLQSENEVPEFMNIQFWPSHNTTHKMQLSLHNQKSNITTGGMNHQRQQENQLQYFHQLIDIYFTTWRKFSQDCKQKHEKKIHEFERYRYTHLLSQIIHLWRDQVVQSGYFLIDILNTHTYKILTKCFYSWRKEHVNLKQWIKIFHNNQSKRVLRNALITWYKNRQLSLDRAKLHFQRKIARYYLYQWYDVYKSRRVIIKELNHAALEDEDCERKVKVELLLNKINELNDNITIDNERECIETIYCEDDTRKRSKKNMTNVINNHVSKGKNVSTDHNLVPSTQDKENNFTNKRVQGIGKVARKKTITKGISRSTPHTGVHVTMNKDERIKANNEKRKIILHNHLHVKNQLHERNILSGYNKDESERQLYMMKRKQEQIESQKIHIERTRMHEALSLARIHYNLNLLRRCMFYSWTYYLQKRRWLTQKADAFCEDRIIHKYYGGFKLLLKMKHDRMRELQKRKFLQADEHYVRYLAAKVMKEWNEWSFHTHVTLFQRVHKLRIFQQKIHTLEKWQSETAYQVIISKRLHLKAKRFDRKFILQRYLRFWKEHVIDLQKLRLEEDIIAKKWLQVKEWLKQS